MKRVRILTFSLCLIPFLVLVFKVFQSDLGPDPAKELALLTGELAINFLLLALAMTPLRQLSGRVEFAQRRRMVGLFALFYSSAHFMVWVVFLLGLRWGAIIEEVVERPYITVGFSSFLILVALGVTSPRAMVRRLGKNWRRLHRLVYVAGVLAVVHLVWIVRTDLSQAFIYGVLLVVLLGWRVVFARHRVRGAA